MVLKLIAIFDGFLKYQVCNACSTGTVIIVLIITAQAHFQVVVKLQHFFYLIAGIF